MITSRTLGPLHFEDLEPKRFEDLVRQLSYDFKQWRRLEATGRSGADDGFDARGFEIVGEPPIEGADPDDEVGPTRDRLWLIQCKRERAISPAKLSKYLDDIRITKGENLYGIVFVAACDFSKRARDLFRTQCESKGIEEWHIWGKAELEDLLYQPRYDSLLFAYFGISLSLRQRSQKSELRSRLSTKRKVHRLLEEHKNRPILLRSPDAHQYPFSREIPNFESQPPWIVRTYLGMNHEGVEVCVRRHFAYFDPSSREWDAAFTVNDMRSREDPWNRNEEDGLPRNEIHEAWTKIPKQNQAWFELQGLIPYDSILEIDELGDEVFQGPHIFVPFNGPKGPFAHIRAVIEGADRFSGPRRFYPINEIDGRIEIFKQEWRTRPGNPS